MVTIQEYGADCQRETICGKCGATLRFYKSDVRYMGNDNTPGIECPACYAKVATVGARIVEDTHGRYKHCKHCGVDYSYKPNDVEITVGDGFIWEHVKCPVCKSKDLLCRYPEEKK